MLRQSLSTATAILLVRLRGALPGFAPSARGAARHDAVV